MMADEYPIGDVKYKVLDLGETLTADEVSIS